MAKIDGRTLDHKALEHIRILAVRRVVEDGEAPSVVMESLGFSRTAIYPWLRKFEQEGWLQKTYPALKRRAKRLGAKIFFLDEAGFQSDPPLGRTYGLKGKTPEVVTSGQRQSLNVISAVNARGEFWAATYAGKLNAEAFVAFLQNFMKGRSGKTFLVIDGHPAHTAKLVDRYLETLEGHLELHRLPSYAPDLNPDEFVWAHMKKNGVSKKPLKQNESLLKRVQKDLVSIKDNRALVRSFFCAESVLYAKD